MIRAETCLYNGRQITVDQALTIRAKAGKKRPAFQCVECERPVKPHCEGGNKPAHIEHFRRNRGCTRSHPRRQK